MQNPPPPPADSAKACRVRISKLTITTNSYTSHQCAQSLSKYHSKTNTTSIFKYHAVFFNGALQS